MEINTFDFISHKQGMYTYKCTHVYFFCHYYYYFVFSALISPGYKTKTTTQTLIHSSEAILRTPEELLDKHQARHHLPSCWAAAPACGPLETLWTNLATLLCGY